MDSTYDYPSGSVIVYGCVAICGAVMGIILTLLTVALFLKLQP